MVSPRILTRNVRKFDWNRMLFPGRLHDVDVWSVCSAEKQAAPQAETGPTWWTQVLNAIKCHENQLIHINIIMTPVVVNDIVMCMWCAVMLNIPILFDRLCRSNWADWGQNSHLMENKFPRPRSRWNFYSFFNWNISNLCLILKGLDFRHCDRCDGTHAKTCKSILVSNCGWSILWVFNVCVAVQLSQLHESITTILQTKPSPEVGKVGKEALDPLMPIAAMQHFRTQISAPKKNGTLCTWTASDCVSCFFESFAVCILWVYGSTSQGHPEPGRGQPSCSKAGALHNSDAIALIHMHDVHGITTDDSDHGFITSTVAFICPNC